MVRNYRCYRRFQYFIKRNTVNIHILKRLLPVLLLLSFFAASIPYHILPQLSELSFNASREAFYHGISCSMVKLDTKKTPDEVSRVFTQQFSSTLVKDLQVPLGSLSGLRYFHNKGPLVHIRFSRFQLVNLAYFSNIASLKVEARILATLPFKKVTHTFEYEFYLPKGN